MYRGWLSFAGNEIANEARTRAYVAELLPRLNMPTRECSDRYADLPRVLNDAPYARPDIDDAPWFDVDDYDSAGFCGFLPLSISGIDDATRDAQVVEFNSPGGAVTGLRRTTREVRVTGLLIGTTPAAVAYGKTWLSTALDGGCDPCEPAELCYLKAMPDPVDSFGDYTSDSIPLTRLRAPSGRYDVHTATFRPGTSTETLQTPGAPQPLPCDEIRWVWTVDGAAGETIELQTLGEKGLTNKEQHILTGGTQVFTISDRGEAERAAHSRLRRVSGTSGIIIRDVTIEYRLPGEPDTCFNKYARQLRGVTCVDGPRTIDEYEPSTGAMERVEFSLVAESPWVWGLPQMVLDITGAQVNKLKPKASGYKMKRTIAVCTEKRSVPLVVDPAAPKIPNAPRPAFPTASSKEPDWYSPYALYIPDGMVPLWGDAVPVLAIHTGANAANAVRVRFYPRPLDNQWPEDVDPCSSCGEFVIDYIPPHSTFTLNGRDEMATIRQSGDRVSRGDHLLSGTGADLFQWPVISCGTGYWVVVDVAASSVAGYTLSLAVRE